MGISPHGAGCPTLFIGKDFWAHIYPGVAVTVARVALSSLTSAAALLVALELGARAIGIEAHGDYVFDEAACYFGWAPHTHGTEHRGKLVHTLDTDQHGFRIVAGKQRPAADVRHCGILVLGDSFTEGLYVSADQTFAAGIEQRLSADGYAVQVDNGGMRGQTILQERIAALGRWRALGHRVVIIEHTANDLRDLTDAARKGCDLRAQAPAAFSSTQRQGWVRQLALYAVAQDLDIRLAAGPAAWLVGHASTDPPSESECHASADEYARQLTDLAIALQGDDRHLLHVMLEPFTCESGRREPDWRAFASTLAGGLEVAGASSLDASEVLQLPGSTLIPLDSHPSPAGHAAIAGRIVERLEQLGWLDSCR